MRSNLLIIYTTVESDDQVRILSKGLIDQKMCACINAFSISSFYEWEGSMHESSERAMIIKTTEYHKNNVIDFLKNNHPYKVPAILEIPVGYAFEPFQNWVFQQVG